MLNESQPAFKERMGRFFKKSRFCAERSEARRIFNGRTSETSEVGVSLEVFSQCCVCFHFAHFIARMLVFQKARSLTLNHLLLSPRSVSLASSELMLPAGILNPRTAFVVGLGERFGAGWESRVTLCVTRCQKARSPLTSLMFNGLCSRLSLISGW